MIDHIHGAGKYEFDAGIAGTRADAFCQTKNDER
jgi:hypothetical protein